MLWGVYLPKKGIDLSTPTVGISFLRSIKSKPPESYVLETLEETFAWLTDTAMGLWSLENREGSMFMPLRY